MSGMDHLLAIERLAGRGLVDAVLVNSAEIPPDLLDHYAETLSEPVRVRREERQELAARGVQVYEADLLASGDLIRHDPPKLAQAVMDLLDRSASL